MLKAVFRGDVSEIQQGVALLKDDLGLVMAEGGCVVDVSIDESAKATLHIKKTGDNVQMICKDKAAFFRSLCLLNAHKDEENYEHEEMRRFDKDGVMFDCSRNAVLKVEELQYMLRKMALMGLTWAMMYTEETYTLDGEPYFGYCRGRYTDDELRALDDYADALGIELIPCIQTLAHLERFLHWRAAAKYRDTVETMLVGSDEVYDLIRRMLISATRPYRSRRIHIGMDEAVDLGRGRQIDLNGYIPPAKLMAEHLKRVQEIVSELGLHAMMWSDMHFNNAGPGGYYGENKNFTDEILESAPADIDLVYWDYYHESELGYDRMLKSHELFKAKTVFAGGTWIWSGIVPDYKKSFTILEPALKQCVKHGVREVFTTAWGDNGAECPMSAILLGLQAFAEYDYTGMTDKAALYKRFTECTGENGAWFERTTEFQYPFECKRPEADFNNICKPLLYEDPLMPLFEQDFAGHPMTKHYENLWHDFEQYANEAEGHPVQPMLKMFAALGRALYAKCVWRDSAAKAVREKDREAALALLPVALENEAALSDLADAWRNVWMYENKPYGFEVIDIRVGGVKARFRSAYLRMQDFAMGRIDSIPELEEKKLPYMIGEDGVYHYEVMWDKIASSSLI